MIRTAIRILDTLDPQTPQETRKRQSNPADVSEVGTPMETGCIPVSPLRIRGIHIADPIIAFPDEKVIGKHDANECTHENPDSGYRGQETRSRRDDLPGDETPTPDNRTEQRGPNEIEMSGRHDRRVDTER